MPPNPFERIFKKNLDNDEVFERTVVKEVSKIINEIGVNQPGLNLAYNKAQELNKERKSPQHKNYLLNLVQGIALSSPDLSVELEMNPSLLEDIKRQIAKLREEED